MRSDVPVAGVAGTVDLLNLPLIPSIRAWTIVGEGFGTGEFVVGRGCRDDVAVACYLPCETLDWARDCGVGSISMSLDDVMRSEWRMPWYISLKTTTPGNRA